MGVRLHGRHRRNPRRRKRHAKDGVFSGEGLFLPRIVTYTAIAFHFSVQSAAVEACGRFCERRGLISTAFRV